MLLIKASSETGLFRHLSEYVFGVRNFENAKSMMVIFFSQYLKFKLYFKKAENNEKKDFVSQIIASELISLNCLY